MGYDNFARLREQDKVRGNKIFWRTFTVSVCLCFFGAECVVVQIWHWPGCLAYIAAPMLGCVLSFGLIFGLPLGLVFLLDALRKANRKAG